MTIVPKTIELKRVVLTGVGVVSSIGVGKEKFLEALLAGRSGIKRISRFDTTEYPVKFAGEIVDFDPLDFIDRKMAKRMDRYALYGATAAGLALEDSGYPVDLMPWEP
jgi:3-oxoacyl-[acyl-carrier-protein] synthase II